MRRTLFFALAALVLLAAGCEQVQEPWVPDHKLAQERARSPETRQILQHRLLYVQTDR